MPAAVVVGAGFAGLLAAAAAAHAGHDVTVLERDRLPTDPRPRSGVPQSPQPHVLLHRGLLAIESLLPGLGRQLLDAGGVPFNTGQMPWLGEFGWMPLNDWSYEIVSISRPLLEQVVRARVLALPRVRLRQGVTVTGLAHTGNGWRLTTRTASDPANSTADATADPTAEVAADLVIDASGRSSRLPHWLAKLGVDVPAPTEVEAKVGYACRAYRGRTELRTGVVVAATPQTQRGALALPIEQDRWLVCAVGFGEHRPGRDVAAFDAFLAGLADPVLAELTATFEPEGEVVIHRQTGNRRYDYARVTRWPPGLLAVGDAMCAFDPVYGQGITVAACQAELLAAALVDPPATAAGTRRLLRRLVASADLPWSVATSEDLRMPSSAGHQNLSQRLTSWWTRRMVRLATGGDEACTRAFATVYHLMGSPLRIFGPAVVAAFLRSAVRGVPAPAPRPAVLASLAQR